MFKVITPLLFLLGGEISLFADHGNQKKPHIVMMLADDMGWRDVGFHGSNIKTPHLDKLASEGVQLEQFYVQPVCTPTRGALMTGRYPIRLGLQLGVVRPWATHGLPLQEETLPQRLKTVGYSTAIVGKWHLGHHSPKHLPTQRGFDQQYGHYNGAIDYFSHVRDGGHDWHRNDERSDDRGYTTDLICKESVRIIESHAAQKTDQPLFLYVPFNAPHTPLQAPKDQITRNAHITEKKRQIYAAMVTSMDDAIGKILAATEKHLDPANTIIFFCSDNGGMNQFGSNGKLRGIKGQLYEGGIRVPAIVKWSKKLKPSVVQEPLHIVDLFPTLTALAKASGKTGLPLDGKNAWPTIAEGKPSPHEVILHNVTPFQGALREGDWKILHNGFLRANATEPVKEDRWELYHLADDPFENNDLKLKNPKIFQRLKTKLIEFRSKAVEPNIPPNTAPAGFKFPKVWGHRD